MKCNQLLNAHGQQMTHDELKVALGFKRSHKYAPDETWTKFAPDGTLVHLMTVAAAAIKAKASLGAGSHRLHALCAQCDTSVPAGRLRQHYKAH